VRSAVEGQRCHTVLATNPPLSAEGLWFVKMFAPWLDPGFRDPAGSGELRRVVTDAEGRGEGLAAQTPGFLFLAPPSADKVSRHANDRHIADCIYQFVIRF
jgi:hypothetical protein